MSSTLKTQNETNKSGTPTASNTVKLLRTTLVVVWREQQIRTCYMSSVLAMLL